MDEMLDTAPLATYFCIPMSSRMVNTMTRAELLQLLR